MTLWLKTFFIFSAVGLLVYFNGLNNQFLMDDFIFVNNPVLSQTKFLAAQWDPYREQSLGVMDTQADLGYYRPLAHIVLNCSYATFKERYAFYHLLNLFLFVSVSFLIYVLVVHLTGNFNLGFLTGLFYLIHPINGIMVNYISASVFCCQAIFMMTTILLLLKSMEQGNDRLLYFLSLVCSLLSLFWNESGIVTPFYVTAVILIFGKETLRKKAVCLLPYFLVIAFYLVLRLNFLNINESLFKKMAFYHLTAGEYLAALFRVDVWYISRLFYPQGIVMQWATPILHAHVMPNVLGIFLLLLIAVLLLMRFYGTGICRLALIWLLIGFAPAALASFRNLENGAYIEPHWMVFSSIGFFILAAYACTWFWERHQRLARICLLVILFSWGWIAHANNRLWADQKTYALYWSSEVPQLKLAYFYLADANQRQGNFKEAKKYYQRALSGHAFDLYTYINFAAIDQAIGDFKSAEEDCRMALKIDPYSAVAYDNLGSIEYINGRLDEAETNLQRASVLNPLLTGPRVGLAAIYLKKSQVQRAIELCLKNLQIVPDDTETLFLLINISAYQRDIVHLKKYAYLIVNNKSDPKILMRLGNAMAAMNMNDIAMDCYSKVLRVAPDEKDAYYQAGLLLKRSGHDREARRLWELGNV